MNFKICSKRYIININDAKVQSLVNAEYFSKK